MKRTYLLFILLLPLITAIDLEMDREKELTFGITPEEPGLHFYLFNLLLLTLISIALVASFLSYWLTSEEKEKRMKSPGWKALMSFSIPHNTLGIFSIERDEDSVPCLTAIRFISFTWVVAANSAAMAASGVNGERVRLETDYILSDIILSASPAVDTFFILSGLLVSYAFFKKVHADPKHACSPINWLLHYVHRYLRLIPAYIIFVLFYTAWTPRLNGALASANPEMMRRSVQNCEDNWWMNALYINNFKASEDMCYGISWFLSCDMQLYWLAPIFLLALHFSWKSGLAAAILGVLLSAASIIYLTIQLDLPAVSYKTTIPSASLDFYDNLYIKPWYRCVPYIVGILCGYLIVQVKKEKIVIRRPKTSKIAIVWLLATLAALFVVFGVYNYLRGYSDWSIAFRAAYGIYSRIGWTAAVAWVILACAFDWAGPVKTLLEHPLWQPLGRLSYCAYLVHWFVLQVLLDDSDLPSYFVSLRHMYFTVTIPVIILSFSFAYFWTCIIEIPFGKIEALAVDLLMNRNDHVRSQSVVKDIHLESGKEEKSTNDAAIEINNRH